MLHGEIITVCFGIHTKHVIVVRVQKVQGLNVNVAVHIANTGPQNVNTNFTPPTSRSVFSRTKPMAVVSGLQACSPALLQPTRT